MSKASNLETDETRFKRIVGYNVGVRRARAGLTLIELADKAGVAYTTIWMCENAKNTTSSFTLFRIAAALGCKVDELAEVSVDAMPV